MGAEDLGLQASETVKTMDAFGNAAQKMAGIGGTLHITEESACEGVVKIAWELSRNTKKPVIIVVKAV